MSIVLLGLAVSAAPSTAGENAGGALIVHTEDAYNFSAGTVCTTTYSTPASCEEAVTRSDKDVGTVVWLLAAFPDSSSPAISGIYFGIDCDDSLSVDQWKMCAPAGSQELPDSGWPYAGRGNSIAFGTPIVGNRLFPFYAFKIDGGADSSYFSTAINPTGGYAAFVDDGFPPAVDEVTKFGTVRWYRAGQNDCPVSGDDSDGGSADETSEGDSQDLDQSESSEGGMDGAIQPGGVVFVGLTTTSDSEFASAARALRSRYGLNVLVGMTPDGLICKLNQGQWDALSADSRVSVVTDEVIPGLSNEPSEYLRPGDAGFASRVWNSMLTKSLADSGSGGRFLPGDEPPYYEETDSVLDELPQRQTSTYMLGDIGVSLLFMDSDSGGTCNSPNYWEDWTSTELQDSYDYIVRAYLDLAKMAPDGYVRFWLAETEVCPTPVEPIQVPYNCDSIWINDAMSHLGFTEQASARGRMRALCNTRRSDPLTPYDWWFITFVIDDSCDPNHRFPAPDTLVSYGSRGGPYEVLLLLNGSGQHFPPEGLSRVAIHETCHIFGAEDEYDSTGACESSTFGYLHVKNGNGLSCVSEGAQLPCIMSGSVDSVLCSFTRGQIGWRDLDIPGDRIYDPIDHPNSSMSMLIGEGDSLCAGDSIDVYDLGGSHWIKRLTASDWSADRGRVLWDGIKYSGLPCSTGTYHWRRNGGTLHAASLANDTQAPVISDLMITHGPGGDAEDTLRFRFHDGDTHAGRIRATAVQDVAEPSLVWIIADSLFRETPGSATPVTAPYSLPEPGEWTISLEVWDVGAGHRARADSTYTHYAVADVGGGSIYIPELAVSPGRPNPSGDWVAWSLDLRSASTVSLSIVGVDGRRIKSWPNRSLPGGTTKILWDGRNERHARVSSGRYYLVVTDKDGRRRSVSATIVR